MAVGRKGEASFTKNKLISKLKEPEDSPSWAEKPKIRNSKRTVGTRECSFNKMEAVPELFFVRIIASSFIVNENNSIGKYQTHYTTLEKVLQTIHRQVLFFLLQYFNKTTKERSVHKMHITLTGNLGSGKSTLSKILEADYGYEIFSTGKVIRKIAEEHGLSVLEMNELMNKDPKYDHEIDDTTARISRENPEKSILFDSRLAWHFVDKSFKVFLSVSLDVAAKRVAGDATRGEVEHYASLEDAKENLKKRAETEDTRYKELYNIEYFNMSNYNLVLDSTDCAPDVLAKILKDEAEAYEKADAEGKGGYSRLILSLNRPEEDFAKEKAAGVVTREILHGVEFLVVTLNK